MNTSDIVIVGGSLNGAALALALAQGGLHCTVVDALPSGVQDDPLFDGRSYAMAAGSVQMLRALGLWENLKSQAQPILEIKVSDGHAGQGPAPQVLHFDHAELEEGPMGQMIEDRHIRRSVLMALETTPGITRISGKSVTAQRVTATGVSVTLSDTTTLDARLLVGADGRQGQTASRAGIGHTKTDYHQTALVCAVEHELPHHGVAHQFFMPAGPLAILPLTGNRSSIVWSETSQTAAAFQALSDEEYLHILRPRFGDFLGEISLAGARYTYPLSLSLADSFIGERLALVGDAARGVHPLAGQGLNAGFRDVAALADVLLAANRRGEDFAAPDVLARYAQWRRFDTTTLALATDGFNRLFSNNNPILRLGRDLGMGAINAVPGLRRRLMREAAGLTGDLPSLMR